MSPSTKGNDDRYENRVREEREAQGLSGRELARRVGIRPTNLCQYEKGKVLPSVLMGQRFAIALGCTVGDLWPLDLASYVRPENGWTCFFCGEHFQNPHKALLHFGSYEDGMAACRLNAEEGGLVVKVRKLEFIVREYRGEDTELHRQIRRMETEHHAALQRAEEDGYARGLRDAQAHPEELGLRKAG